MASKCQGAPRTGLAARSYNAFYSVRYRECRAYCSSTIVGTEVLEGSIGITARHGQSKGDEGGVGKTSDASISCWIEILVIGEFFFSFFLHVLSLYTSFWVLTDLSAATSNNLARLSDPYLFISALSRRV